MYQFYLSLYDDSMVAIYSIMSIGIPYRDPVSEFLGNKQGMIYKTLLLYEKKYLLEFQKLMSKHYMNYS